MTDDTRDRLDALCREYDETYKARGHLGSISIGLSKACVDAYRNGNLIPADEADARVAAARREGMERAAGIADRAAEEIDRDRGLSADSAIAAGIAAAIRAHVLERDAR